MPAIDGVPFSDRERRDDSNRHEKFLDKGPLSLNTFGHLCSAEDVQERILPAGPLKPGGPEMFREALRRLLFGAVNTSSPGFLDKLFSTPLPPGIAADLILSLLNNNGHVWHVSPALTLIEKNVALRLARLFGLQGPHAGGMTVPGGAAANITALLIARNILLPETKKLGFGSGNRRPILFVSQAAHYSVANAAQVIGLGTASVVRIVTRSNGEMDPDALEQSTVQNKLIGNEPFFVAATAGTTVKGVFDPLQTIGGIARKYNLWYHVDACWGGAAAFSEALKSRMNGSELADSISFNPHKLLRVPLLCSFLIARDLRTFWCANQLEAGYLFHDDKEEAEVNAVDEGTSKLSVQKAGLDQGEADLPNRLTGEGLDGDLRTSKDVLSAPNASNILNLASLTPQCGRRPDGLKLYMHWLYYRTESIARDVETAVEGARLLALRISSEVRLRLVGNLPEVPFAQVCFYYNGKLSRDPLGKSLERQMNSKATRSLSRLLLKQGWMIDYAPGDGSHNEQGEFLRVACNRSTTPPVVDKLMKAIILAVDLYENDQS